MSTLDQTIDNLAPGEPFEIVLSETELTALATSYATSHAAMGLSDVAVHLLDGGIEVSGKTKMVGLSMDVRIAGTASLVEGKTKLEVAKLELNGTPAPSFLKNQIVNAVNGQLEPESLPVLIETLSITGKEVRVTGTKK